MFILDAVSVPIVIVEDESLVGRSQLLVCSWSGLPGCWSWSFLGSCWGKRRSGSFLGFVVRWLFWCLPQRVCLRCDFRAGFLGRCIDICSYCGSGSTGFLWCHRISFSFQSVLVEMRLFRVEHVLEYEEVGLDCKAFLFVSREGGFIELLVLQLLRLGKLVNLAEVHALEDLESDIAEEVP